VKPCIAKLNRSIYKCQHVIYSTRYCVKLADPGGRGHMIFMLQTLIFLFFSFARFARDTLININRAKNAIIWLLLQTSTFQWNFYPPPLPRRWQRPRPHKVKSWIRHWWNTGPCKWIIGSVRSSIALGNYVWRPLVSRTMTNKKRIGLII